MRFHSLCKIDRTFPWHLLHSPSTNVLAFDLGCRLSLPLTAHNPCPMASITFQTINHHHRRRRLCSSSVYINVSFHHDKWSLRNRSCRHLRPGQTKDHLRRHPPWHDIVFNHSRHRRKVFILNSSNSNSNSNRWKIGHRAVDQAWVSCRSATHRHRTRSLL